MPLPRFSEMLVEQRQNLDISLSTAAHVLRIKEVTLDAFERGDFERMPQSGYAQGMLASYARYLGLNPNIVTSLYAEDLYEYEHGASSRELRQRSRRLRSSEASELPSYERADNSPAGRARTRRISSVRSDGLSTSAPVQRKGRGLVSGPPGRYSTQHSDEPANQQPERNAPRTQSFFGSRNTTSTPLVTSRPYTSAASQARVRSASGRTGYHSSMAGAPVGAAAASRYQSSPYESGEIRMQRFSPSQYTDDLVYDQVVDSYAPASTRRGAEASRNIAPRDRPRVERDRGTRPRNSGSRNGRSSAGRSRNQRPQQQQGLIGRLFAERRNIALLLSGILVLVLVFVIVNFVRSCTKPADEEKPEQVGVTTVKRDDEAESVTTQPVSAASPETPAAPVSSTTTTTTTTTTTNALATSSSSDGSVKVGVEVLDGEVAWVEIVCDGKSDAETVTGPKTFEYTVHQSISISVNNTGAVKVTRNGQQVPFDSKVQGLGSLTIQAPGAQDSSDGSSSGSSSSGTNLGGSNDSESEDEDYYEEEY